MEATGASSGIESASVDVSVKVQEPVDLISDSDVGGSPHVVTNSGSIELPSHIGPAGDSASSNFTELRSSRTPIPTMSDEVQTVHLPKIYLSDVDKKRLHAVANLLKCKHIETILDCCEVFQNQILENFPLNAFLQESKILEILISSIEHTVKHPESVKLTFQFLRCLNKLLNKMAFELIKNKDPNMAILSQVHEPYQKSSPGIQHTWSVIEVCWAGLTTSAECLKRSESNAILKEAVAMLRTSLCMHAAFFPDACADEICRLSLLLAEIIISKPPAFVYIQVLHFITKFANQRSLAIKQSGVLQRALQDAVLNAGIWCLNPDLRHNLLFLLNDVPDNKTFCKLVGGVIKLCHALSSAQEILIVSGNVFDQAKLEEAIVSVDFVPNPQVARAVIEIICRSRGWNTSSTLLKLLSHSNDDIKTETYEYCLSVVIASIGIGQAKDPITYTPNHIAFLCTDKVIQEMTCFGLTHESHKVQNAAENILMHLIKCRLLVSSTLWSQISSCLAYLIPLLTSTVSYNKNLGQAVIAYLHPNQKNTDTFQCVRGNACLLFSANEGVRVEAASRLLSIIANHSQTYEKWPQISSVSTDSHSTSSLCVVKEPFVISRDPATIYYSESSMRQIIALLEPGFSESSVRHSALCQLAAMLLEPRLVPVFVQAGAVETCVKLLDLALIRNNTDVLSKSLKPIISILCLVASSNNSICHSLAESDNLMLNLVRAMFLYSNLENDFQHYHSALLGMLLLSDFIRHKATEDCIMLPLQVKEGWLLPFKAGVYARVSSHTPMDHWQQLKTFVDGKSDHLSLLLRCHLTLETAESLAISAEAERAGHLRKKEIEYLLQLDPYASLLKAFKEVQSATNHDQVMSTLPILASYLPCVQPHDLPWAESFSIFISQSPCTHEDAVLLNEIIKLISEHADISWLPWEDIINKFDARKLCTIDKYLPLLEKCATVLDEKSISRAIVCVCRCLAAHDFEQDDYVLRKLLQCLNQLINVHKVEFSTRLMADVMGPLLNITCQFNDGTSLIIIGLIEEALLCLASIQSNNLKTFAHHFCASSENYDIFRTMSQIISSDKYICKSTTFTILAGLSKFNALKNNVMDLACYIKQSISIALDKNEMTFVRHQAVVFLSSVVENPNEVEVEVLIKLLSESRWFEHIPLYGHGLQLKYNSFCNSITIHDEISTNERLIEATTPEYLAAHFSFLYNLSVAIPLTMLDKIQEYELFSVALSALSKCLIDINAANEGICELIKQTANFLSYCLITDESDRFSKKLNDFPYLEPQILGILSSKEFTVLSSSTFWLMLAMQQCDHGNQFVEAYQQGYFWSPIATALNNPKAEHAALLITRALGLQVEAPQQSVKSEKINDGSAQLCELLILRLQREETHQAAMAALSGLLAAWPQAREAALKMGLLESIITALCHCYNGLLTVRDHKQLAHSDKQTHPLVEEIIDSFELLVGFMLNDDQVKKAASETSLAEEISKLWPVCLANSRVCDSVIKLLAVYTSNSANACTSLLLRQHLVGGVKVKRCAANVSLYHQVTQLASMHLTVIGSRVICPALDVLTNCCSSPECCCTLVKTSLLQNIFASNSGIHRLSLAVQKSVLLLVEKFTRHVEGQQAIARIPEAIESLCVLGMELKGNPELNYISVEILRNVCFCHANRVLVVTSGNILSCFLALLKKADPANVRQVALAVWSVAANHHRSKQALKVAGFQQALSKARIHCSVATDVLTILDTTLQVFYES